jgi:hypothetical protein
MKLLRCMQSGLLALGVWFALTLTGCTNAVYLYQTAKVSFTAEGKADAAEPVSASLGAKERVVLIVPSGDPDAVRNRRPSKEVSRHEVQSDGTIRAVREPRSDALSTITYFDFVKTAGTGWFNDEFLIRSGLITGQAADQLTEEKAKEAFASFATIPSERFDMAALTLIYGQAKKLRTSDPEANAIFGQFNALAALLPQRTLELTVYDNGNAANTVKPVTGFARGDARNAAADFDEVQSYIAKLDKSVEVLTPANITIEGDNRAAAIVRPLLDIEKNAAKAEATSLRKQIGKQGAISAAILWFSNRARSQP